MSIVSLAGTRLHLVEEASRLENLRNVFNPGALATAGACPKACSAVDTRLVASDLKVRSCVTKKIKIPR